MIRAQRGAISAMFLIIGIGIGAWAAFIPIVKERLALNDAALAVVLLCAAAGAIVAMPACGALCDRYGSRRLIAAGGTLYGMALGYTTAAPSYGPLLGAAFIMGIGNGTLDVSINVNGITLGRRAGRPVMSSLHALVSVGTFVAAGAMAGVVAARWPHGTASAGVAIVIAAAALSALPLLVREDPQPHVRRRRSRRIPARLLWLGVAAICGAVSEGALVGWSGIYLRESLHVSISAALGGFAAYAVAMSAARFSGDWIVDRTGRVRLIRAGGIIAAGGIALALIVHTYSAVLAGFFIAGIGLANVSPIVYGAGGDDAQAGSGAGVAVVTTLGYGGFFIGPSLIGFTAAHSSIDVAFAFVGVFALTIAALAPVVRVPDRAPPAGVSR